MTSLNEFSTNRHSLALTDHNSVSATRHPDIFFSDANVAVLAHDIYFLVHKGVLSRHSLPLAQAIKAMETASPRLVENLPILELDDLSDDLFYFLTALYDGISTLQYGPGEFHVFSAILRLATKYDVKHIRIEIIRGMSVAWPQTLAQWDTREANATTPGGMYKPRASIPHPILVINLARETNVPKLLPASFYDLSRCAASDIVAGFIYPKNGILQTLSETDLKQLLQGKESGSRYLSTFIVNELEGRIPSNHCLFRADQDTARRRFCQSTFEAITFEILRDINGVVLNRSVDPLFAIADAELMQIRDESDDRITAAARTCEACRSEFTAAADAAREEMWSKLPKWFGIDLDNWS